ncbi:MAG TPA: NADAR family protein [Clostridiales bacterium]|nr:NADAR family protein [Clostridiales bacterium]
MLTFSKNNSVVFCKTKDKYGGLSNMCAGYPINVNGVIFNTSEALYQSLKFPHNVEVQRKILEARSPMAAKMISKEFIEFERPDWREVNIDIMRWCLRAKLICNWSKLGELLMSTYNLQIVELSYKDDFWGAKPIGDNFKGYNILGRLLNELRDDYIKTGDRACYQLKPLNIPDFLLFNEQIEKIVITRNHTKGI